MVQFWKYNFVCFCLSVECMLQNDQKMSFKDQFDFSRHVTLSDCIVWIQDQDYFMLFP